MVESGLETVENRSHSNNNNNNSNNKDENVDESVLPHNCMPLAHQVAGHFFGKGKTKLGLLQSNDGFVLKPVQSPPRGEREHNFFKRLFQSDDSLLNSDEIELRNLLPTYRGCLNHNDIIYIKMDDLTKGLKCPAVIDFKIGKITHDPEASFDKITRQKSKYPPVEKIGFQLLGMRVYDKKSDSFCHYDKIFGRSLSEQDLIHGLALYYQFHQRPQIRAIQETIKKFEEVKRWFEKQKTYHFFSSSLIVTYEANLEDMLDMSSDSNLINEIIDERDETTIINNNNNHINQAPNLVRIVMADFAHVFPADNKIDQNYLDGLENLIKYLKVLIDPAYKFRDVRKDY